MSATKNAIKSLIPKPLLRQVIRPVLRHIELSKQAKFLRGFYFGEQLSRLKPILFESGETHNFTYDLTDINLRYLAEVVAVATGKPSVEIERFILEAMDDRELRIHFDGKMSSYDGQRSPANVKSPFGRRLGWYALARAIKPRLIVETGVERGHGALLLCAALLRNSEEGIAGHYLGTDISPSAGYLLSGKYQTVGEILYGDSIASLQKIKGPIDLFINDSDHSADYEAEEYKTVAPKLSADAIILGDNAHVTDKLARFSRETGRSFLMFKEHPKDHWYPGGGIGISFRRGEISAHSG